MNCSAGCFALLLAFLLVAHQLGILVHTLTVSHVICPHGELTHVRHEVLQRQRLPVSGQRVSTHRENGDAHEHGCVLTTSSQRGEAERTTDLVVVGALATAVVQLKQAFFFRTDILQFAPKLSPPIVS